MFADATKADFRSVFSVPGVGMEMKREERYIFAVSSCVWGFAGTQDF
jgi:hypothetical protein